MSYCDRDDVEAIFGVQHVLKYADLDGDQNDTKIATRITWAITVADAEIDDALRMSSHQVIPIVSQDGTTPTMITHLSAILAGIWLYEFRGGEDINAVTGQRMHRYAFLRTWGRRLLANIQTSKVKLDAL